MLLHFWLPSTTLVSGSGKDRQIEVLTTAVFVMNKVLCAQLITLPNLQQNRDEWISHLCTIEVMALEEHILFNSKNSIRRSRISEQFEKKIVKNFI